MEYPEWYKQVYRASQFPKSEREYWERVSDYVIERDERRCQACRKSAKKKDLSVHHITPRSEGGSDELDNLITLHHHCHDYVEVMAFRSIDQIIGCAKGLRKAEILDIGIDADIPERKNRLSEGEAPNDLSIEDIICPCGIHHPRKKSEIGNNCKEIKCICGRAAEYIGDAWKWREPIKSTPSTANPGEGKTIKEKVYSHSLIVCPVCNTEIAYLKNRQKFNGVKCPKCGSESTYQNGLFYWRVLAVVSPTDVFDDAK